ncbi:hypothetical protein Psta_1607 [Pirellula staleyi DSM 6068]|uniref:Uncharacterized protein n=1 Tax=Pirellula staleyi (strain ATCC 27377 / DSM 6068 / ICPB 4128) TaxID=530564 RepID=D2QY68_PIRSD|nr:hypothetical protein [Pirellula staleyi]ADB16282.1 hypothetical protein Psta_1607 [Pirellula staleyi DSM 6068]
MNEQLRQAIHKRARKARSNDDLVNAVFFTFEDAHIDPRHVSLDDMKIAVVEAARAARLAREAKLPATPVPAAAQAI